MKPAPSRLWSIGHSSLQLAELMALLEQHEIALVADVRRFPGSRAHPQFNPEPFARSLAEAQIDYQPFHELGGRRKARPDSLNTVAPPEDRTRLFTGLVREIEQFMAAHPEERLDEAGGTSRAATFAPHLLQDGHDIRQARARFPTICCTPEPCR